MTKDFSSYPVTLQSVATVSDFRRHLAHYIASVRYGRDRVEIRRKDAEPVYLVSAADFEVIAERVAPLDEGPVASWGERDPSGSFWARLGKTLTPVGRVLPGKHVEPGMPEVIITKDADPVPPPSWEEAMTDADRARRASLQAKLAEMKAQQEARRAEWSEEERAEHEAQRATIKAEVAREAAEAETAQAEPEPHYTEQDIREEEERVARLSEFDRKWDRVKKGFFDPWE
ncbi:MAG: type II toxin-antitoxin system prevent-host-death family antitoxin [Pseudomonadota bacterium]